MLFNKLPEIETEPLNPTELQSGCCDCVAKLIKTFLIHHPLWVLLMECRNAAKIQSKKFYI